MSRWRRLSSFRSRWFCTARDRLSRSDGCLEAALSGAHHDRHVRSSFQNSLAEDDAVHLRHAQVGEDDVEVLLDDAL